MSSVRAHTEVNSKISIFTQLQHCLKDPIKHKQLGMFLKKFLEPNTQPDEEIDLSTLTADYILSSFEVLYSTKPSFKNRLSNFLTQMTATKRPKRKQPSMQPSTAARVPQSKIPAKKPRTPSPKSSPNLQPTGAESVPSTSPSSPAHTPRSDPVIQSPDVDEDQRLPLTLCARCQVLRHVLLALLK